MRESLTAYVKRVQELAEVVRGNEQATKQSLIAPLFTLLGYDLTDPRECMPEFRADFGKGRSVKPVDWAFMQSGRPTFFVEAKDAGKRLGGYDEQLADYFAKEPEAKIGILTNGVQWRFFTDLVHENVMDKEPFVEWDVLGNAPPPFDFLMRFQKSQYSMPMIRLFAEGRRKQSLLVTEIAKLLEPSPEFTKLAIENHETRTRTEKVLDEWKPIVANAIREWAKESALAMATAPRAVDESDAVGEESSKISKIETTQEELDAFALVSRVLGDRKIAYTDTVSYFKIHLPERHTWVVCRLYLGRRRPKVWISLPVDQVRMMLPAADVTAPEEGWACVTLESPAAISELGEALAASWDKARAEHPAGA